MFTNQALKKLIVPLFLEQFLVMLVGLADTFIISFAGETAVSGVSLVNSFNTIFIYLFTALASGGAVVISQYLGRKEDDLAGESSSQLLMFSALFSLTCTAVILLFNRQIMGLMFGKVETEVMSACVTYLGISACSYPFMAVYNAGAALYRSKGDTRTTMVISVFSNLINVAGNCIGVLVLKAGVAGVAVPTLLSWIFSAAAITVLCFCRKKGAGYRLNWILKWNGALLKKMLGIAIPNSAENAVFQLVKVALSSVVALFGTYQIAANGVAQSIWSLAALAGLAMGPAFITVIGQSMGSGDSEEAERAFRKMTKITLIFSLVWNALVFALTPLFMMAFQLDPETKKLVIWLVLIHNVFNAFAFPFSGPLGTGLRATGDVKFTMLVSIASTIGGRLAFSLLFALVFRMGVIGIAFAMCLDWMIRAVIFWLRFKSGKWKSYKVI